jgi:hypothetical protein
VKGLYKEPSLKSFYSYWINSMPEYRLRAPLWLAPILIISGLIVIFIFIVIASSPDYNQGFNFIFALAVFVTLMPGLFIYLRVLILYLHLKFGGLKKIQKMKACRSHEGVVKFWVETCTKCGFIINDDVPLTQEEENRIDEYIFKKHHK